MARTRSKQYPENRSLILDQAAALFAAQGFHRASIADLARACDYSKASIYHYYESKEVILFDLLDAHLDELGDLVKQVFQDGGDPRTQFANFVREAMQLYVQKVNYHTVLNRDIRYLPETLRSRIRLKEQTLLARVTDVLRHIRPDLAGKPGSEKVCGLLFFGMLNWTYTWYRADGRYTVEQFADLAVELFLHGLINADLSHLPAPLPQAGNA